MEHENSSDDQGGHGIGQDPHRTIFLRSLEGGRQTHPRSKVKLLVTVDKCVAAECAHHEEERLVDAGQDVDGVGGDGLSSSTPGQSVEPRLADHVQVSSDVHRLVLAAERQSAQSSNLRMDPQP